MALRAVAFDLDGTLVVTDRDRETLLQTALDSVDGPPISREEYLRAHDADLATETRRPIFAELLSEYDGDTSPARLATAYRDRIEEALVPVEGAEQLLERLREEYRLGVVTDGPTRAQSGKLETLGWTDRFDATVITGDLPSGKPARYAFDALLDELGVVASETAYVGDHPEYDVEGAKDAGLYAIQVLGSGDERHPRADGYVERERLAGELPSLLKRLS